MNATEIDEHCEAAFAAYNERAGGKTWDGKPIPPWKECGPRVRNNWRAAIVAVLDRLDGFVVIFDTMSDVPGFTPQFEEVEPSSSHATKVSDDVAKERARCLAVCLRRTDTRKKQADRARAEGEPEIAMCHSLKGSEAAACADEIDREAAKEHRRKVYGEGSP